MPRVMVPLRPKGLPMAYTFCPTARLLRVASFSRRQDSARNLDHGKIVDRSVPTIWPCIFSCRWWSPPALARSFHHVEVGQDVAFAVDDKARAHALLRHRAVKKIKGHCGRSNVHHRGQRLLVDGDVVLLFRIVGAGPAASVNSTCEGRVTQEGPSGPLRRLVM